MTWFVYAIIAAFFASLAAIIEKKKLEHIHSSDFVVIQAIVTALITLPVLFWGDWRTITWQILGLAYFISLIVTIAMRDVTKGVRHLEISEASPLFLLNPLFTTILAFLLLGEKITILQTVGITLLALGAYILETPHFFQFKEFWGNITRNQYAKLIILGMFLYSCAALLDRIALGTLKASPILYVALIQIFLAVNFVAFTFWKHKNLTRINTAWKQNWKGCLLVGVSATGHRLMYAEAVAITSAVGLVSAVKRSSSLFTTVVGGEVFRDHDLIRKSIACVVMIFGVFLVSGVY